MSARRSSTASLPSLIPGRPPFAQRDLGLEDLAALYLDKVKLDPLKGDEGMHKIATRFRVGTGTVQRIRAEMAA
jgi:hypothetical protein